MVAVLERRKSKRFALQLPVTLVRAGSRSLGVPGLTQNLSSGGVLFTSTAALELGEPLEYQITLPAAPGSAHEVRLRCLGKIVRRPTSRPEAGGAPGERLTAATLERYEFLRD